MSAWRTGTALWLVAGMLYACSKPEYTIQRSLRTGEQWRYTLGLQVELDSKTDLLELTYTDTVQTVQPDGSAIVNRTLQMPKAQLQQLQSVAAPFGELKPTTRWQFFPNGREKPLDKDAFVIGAFTYIYPDRPVPIGAQWGRTDGVGSLQVKYICRLEGIERVDNVRCYKIHTQIEPMPDSLPQMWGEMTVHVDSERGWVRQIRGTLNMQAGELTGTFQLRLRGAPAGEPR
ncbi:MAG: hypothetical protein KatS3mg020_0058 [Fimbriimonadales bacterium]|nr:MAG: hypothetical protein KatS3mg020_0058 [Fimbriimonadales bacterium]